MQLSERAALPLVTIVTPSYNQAKFLEDCIRSVLAQDYPLIEYLVIDGASSDQSVDIIRNYADRIAYWESQPDRGQAHAINKGLQRAQGELLGWLNSDDVLAPGAVSRAVQALMDHVEIGVVYGRLERIDAQGRLLPTPELPKDRLTFGLKHVIGECIVNQPGALWRRSAMEKVGLLNEDLRYSLDYEYWIRMALVGVAFMRLPEVLAQFRLSSESKTVGQTAEMALEQLEVLEKLISQPGIEEQLKLSPAELQRRSDHARAVIGLHAAYGDYKQGKLQSALVWLVRSARRDPAVLFEQRWRDLLRSGIKRRLGP